MIILWQQTWLIRFKHESRPNGGFPFGGAGNNHSFQEFSFSYISAMFGIGLRDKFWMM